MHTKNTNPYETSALLSQYLLFHYGSVEQTVGNLPAPREACEFPRRVVESLLDPSRLPRDGSRVLDVGCAVGATSFYLSQYFQEVVGVDLSTSFILAAQQLAEAGRIQTKVVVEGERTEDFIALIPEGAAPKRIRFLVADACDLPQELGKFHAILASNLLCRLPEPRAFLRSLPDFLLPGGQLLLATPFSWLEEFTPKMNWLGGLQDAEPSFEILKKELESYFILEKTIEIPFLLREHARKFQYGISFGTRWIRK